MAISFVSGTTKTETAAPGRTGDGTFTATLSSWSAGDLAVLILYNDQGSGAITTPATGWTQLTGSPFGTGTEKLQIFYRFMQAGDSSPTITISGSGTNISHCCNCAVYSGVDTSDTFHKIGTANQGTSATVTANGVTTTVDNCMLLFASGLGDNHSHSGQTINSSATGVTEQLDGGTNAGSDSQVQMCDKLIASAGATGNGSATAAGSDPFVAIIVALRPNRYIEGVAAAVGDVNPEPDAPSAKVAGVVGDVDGETALSGVGRALTLGTAAATGTATIDFDTAVCAGGVGAATGSAATDFDTVSVVAGVYASTGTTTPAALSCNFAGVVGSVSSSTSTDIIACSINKTEATTTGESTCDFDSQAIAGVVADSSGDAEDLGVSAALWNVDASSTGLTEVLGESEETGSGSDFLSEGASVVEAVGAASIEVIGFIQSDAGITFAKCYGYSAHIFECSGSVESTSECEYVSTPYVLPEDEPTDYIRVPVSTIEIDSEYEPITGYSTSYVDDSGYDPGYTIISYPAEVLRATFENADFSEWTSANGNCFIRAAGSLDFDISGNYCARLYGYRSMIWIVDEPEEVFGYGVLIKTFTIAEPVNFNLSFYAKIGENVPAFNAAILKPGSAVYESMLVISYHTDVMVRYNYEGYIDTAGEVSISIYSSAPTGYGSNNSFLDQVVVTLLSPYSDYDDLTASGTTEYIDV